VTTRRLDPSPESVHDVFSRQRPPAITIEPGDTVLVTTLDAAGYLRRQVAPGEQPPMRLPSLRGHCLTGPIHIHGARPGDTLSVHLDALVPDPWGWTVVAAQHSFLNTRLGVSGDAPTWLLWDIDVQHGIAVSDRGLGIAIAPFLGVLGTAPAEHGEHSTIPPRSATGGNIDCRELVAGSTLFLPVLVPGALLSVGDGHAAQGDGEVGGTAIECGMTTRLVIDLVDAPPVLGLHAVTPSGRLTFGFGSDLREATVEALNAMLTWIQALLAVERPTALAMASVCVDLRLTQVVNQTWGVHAVLSHAHAARWLGESDGPREPPARSQHV
jgi:acetamidase/formamidase